MDVKEFNLPENIKISLVIIKNTKFLTISSNLSTKYISVPSSIGIQKKGNILLFSNILGKDFKVSELNQFINRLQFGIKNLTTNFKKRLILKGLGFRVNINAGMKNAEFKLGFSHLINLKIPENVKMKSTKSFIKIESTDNVLLGNFVNKIIDLKFPDSYKGKGFWYKYQKKTLKVVKKK